MKFFIVTNTSKLEALKLATQVKKFIADHGGIIVDQPDSANIILTLGGDGTLLRAWHDYCKNTAFYFGINCGHLGYLAEASLENWKEKLILLLNAKKTLVEGRITLEASLNSTKLNIRALNEFTATRKDKGLLEYDIFADDKYLMSCKADGIIVATPTGSTAYALSAGGSFIDPKAELLELVPICPHSLMNRSTILSSSSKVKIIFNSYGTLCADGTVSYDIVPGDVLEVSRAYLQAWFAVAEPASFIEQIAKNF